jgi:Plavaka transposase
MTAPQPESHDGVEIPKWMENEYEIWFRDPRLLFKNMLANRDFNTSFDYAPFRQYDDNGNRRYENLMSGDWAWKQAVS